MERKKQRIIISGSGINACLAVGHFIKWSDLEIFWLISDSKDTIEILSPNLYYDIFHYFRKNLFEKINVQVFLGYHNQGFGSVRREFVRYFTPSRHGYTMSSTLYRDVLVQHIKHKFPQVKIIDNPDLDFDFKIEFEDHGNIEKSFFSISNSYANSEIIEYEDRLHIKNIVRQHGWIQLIPHSTTKTQLRYYFHKDFDNNTNIKNDLEKFGNEYKVRLSDIEVNDYYSTYLRENIFNDNIIYNGLAAFNIEPIEHFNSSLTNLITRYSFDLIHKNIDSQTANEKIKEKFLQMERIMLLYFAADNKFQQTSKYWQHNKWLAWQSIEHMVQDKIFKEFGQKANRDFWLSQEYGIWSQAEYIRSIENLGLPFNIENLNGDN